MKYHGSKRTSGPHLSNTVVQEILKNWIGKWPNLKENELEQIKLLRDTIYVLSLYVKANRKAQEPRFKPWTYHYRATIKYLIIYLERNYYFMSFSTGKIKRF